VKAALANDAWKGGLYHGFKGASRKRKHIIEGNRFFGVVAGFQAIEICFIR